MKIPRPIVAGIICGLAVVSVILSHASARALTNCYTTEQDLAPNELQMVVLMNQHRAAIGRAPLKVSPSLNRMAAWMANDQATKVGLSHTDSLGRNPWQRAADCGAVASGENAAVTGPDALTTFNAWMNSPGHKAIIEGNFRMVGIGNHGAYWTADFGNVDDSVVVPPNAHRLRMLGLARD